MVAPPHFHPQIYPQMSTVLPRRYVLRQNWVMILGIVLCLYFAYHLVLGERSYVRLIGLRHAIARTEVDIVAANQAHASLEKQVEMLRPGSLNRDYLEERARLMLGYRSADDIDVMVKDR
jgi:cell division protein FtsB